MRFFLFLCVLFLVGCPLHGDSGKVSDTGETGAACVTDADGDGFLNSSCGGNDCNDEDPAIYPGADEVCDGVNNDCNGGSEDDISDWLCQDYDRDGFGDPEVCSFECKAREGYVFDATDCDDFGYATNPSAIEVCDNIDNDCDGNVDEGTEGDVTWYHDNDGDGYGEDDDTSNACDQPEGYVLEGGDCNKYDKAVNPGEIDVCDGIDNDCDGNVDDAEDCEVNGDADGDGYSWSEGDCNDGNSAINPDATEICDGIDNDCDGSTDGSDAVDTLVLYVDADGDGYGEGEEVGSDCRILSGFAVSNTDCDDGDSAINPGATEVCDGVDNDCDGGTDEGVGDVIVWYVDTDSDGYGDSTNSVVACEAPEGYVINDTDCDDDDRTINPDATEICDGIDNDCDGSTDGSDAADATTWYVDTDSDGYGDSTNSVVACEAPEGYVSNDTDCDDDDRTINPSATEVCDEFDNDCDGSVDVDDPSAVDVGPYYGDSDGDGYGDDASGMLACEAPEGYVSKGGDCDDDDSVINPDAIEICDGIDNDCVDGIDNDVEFSEFYIDVDGDGYGDSADSVVACETPEGYVSKGGDCDDANARVFPAAPESCDNSADDPVDYNCDGSAGGEDNDGDGYQSCKECDDSDAAINPLAPEMCDGTDNDCDGSIDNDATDAAAWYIDIDNDGYGDASTMTWSCDAVVGYVDNSDDCNDRAGEAYLDATEVCDTIDNNCDGSVDEDGVCDTGGDTGSVDTGDTGSMDTGSDTDTGTPVDTSVDTGAMDTGGDTGGVDTGDSGGGDTSTTITTHYETDFGDGGICSTDPWSRSDGGSMTYASWNDGAGGCGTYVFGGGNASEPFIALVYSVSGYVEDTVYTATMTVENVASSPITFYTNFGGGAIVSESIPVGDKKTVTVGWTADALGSATLQAWDNYTGETANYGLAILDLTITY